MSQWLSFNRILGAVLLMVTGIAAKQAGWLPVIEFGGTQTGSLAEHEAPPPFSDLEDADTVTTLEFEADDSLPPLEVGGRTAEVRPEPPTLLLDDASGESAVENANSTDVVPALALEAARSSGGSLRLVSEEQSRSTESDAARPKELNVANEEEAQPAPTESSEAGDVPPVRIAKRPQDGAVPLDLTSIDQQIKSGKIVEAHKELSKLFWQQPDSRSRIQERIDATAKAIYFSPLPHVQEPYVVQPGDQLRKIASKYRVTWAYLAKLNRTDPRRLRAGQKLKVINGPFGAVVTLSDFDLVLHHNGQYVRRYRVCIGKDDSTPVGKFKVLNKVTHPQYTDPDGKVFEGDDPNNPLGSHWLDLGDSYGIHGTIEPESIGKAESRGCVRMLNTDVTEVFDVLDVGSEVVIRP